MQGIGFTPRRNITPAFGCVNCYEIKTELSKAGATPKEAQSYLNIAGLSSGRSKEVIDYIKTREGTREVKQVFLHEEQAGDLLAFVKTSAAEILANLRKPLKK